jgi:O-antigen ligase
LIFQTGTRKRRVSLLHVAPTHLRSDGVVALAGNHAVPSCDSPRHLGRAVAYLRKQTAGRILNGWLALIMLLAGSIAVVDGLTRAPNPSWGVTVQDAQGPLEYEPYVAAFVLAAVTLPLMLVYAKRVRASTAEGLFLWFAFCTTAYMKDFSYLRWPGVPLFVTDVVLIFLLFSICVLPQPRHSHRPLALNVALFLFLAAGMFSALRGFLGHHNTIFVLRDSALVGYSLFLLVGYHLLSSWLSMKRAAVWFLLGTAVSTFNGLAWFFAAPEQRRFIAPGIYILISLVAAVLAVLNRQMRPLVGWAFIGLLGLGLILANARSLFVTLTILLLFGWLCRFPKYKRSTAGRRAGTLLAPAVLILGASFLFLTTHQWRDFAERSTEDLDSGVFHSGVDGNWQFRLAAWKEAWHRFEEYPPAGEGFGIPFIFDIWDNDPRPHNTFLTVLYKMGLIGFLPLLTLLSFFFLRAFKTLQRHHSDRHALFLQTLVIGELAFCFYGMANIVLESPFLASLFWGGMGIGLRAMDNLNAGRSTQSQTHLARRGDKTQQIFTPSILGMEVSGE